MLKIENGINITLNNVVSFRKKMHQEEISAEIEKIGRYLESKGVNKKGPLITTTSGIEVKDGKYNIDMELMIPVDKKTDLLPGYEMKDVFQLTDAVYVRHKGNPVKLQDTYNQAISYMQTNDMKFKSAYNFYMNETEIADDIIIDIYFVQ